MERKFTALRIIGTIFKILAWLALIFGLLGAVGLLIAGIASSGQEGLLGLDLAGPLGGVAAFVVTLIAAIIYFLMLYAVGESIYLFLAVEENTRQMANLMQQQYAAQRPVYPSQPKAYGQ